MRGNIITEGNVYCDGNYGCYNVSGRIQGYDVSVYGNRGGYTSTIMAENDINCSGYMSCYMGVIKAGNKVIVEANYAAYGANINVGGDVNCDAKLSCGKSTIVAGGLVIGRSTQSIIHSIITARTVIGYGDESISYSNIMQIFGEPLLVSISGNRAAYKSNIYCRDEELCEIVCYSRSGCEETRVYYSDTDNISSGPRDCIEKSGEKSEEVEGVTCPYFVEESAQEIEAMINEALS